ncbi:MAG: hypothetical protein N2652_06485 [Kiritimatiellae bacterium]|nr:hypothetical protein [Kiritimatiellia bacterium]
MKLLPLSLRRLGTLGVVLLVALAAAPGCRRKPSVPAEVHQAADALTAAALDEAVALAGAGGDVVLVDVERTPELTDPFSARAIAGIRAGLAARGLTLRAEERLPINPQIERTGEALRKNDFLELLRRHASAKLVVLFVPPPLLAAGEMSALPTPRPKILLVTNWQAPQLAKLPKGLIQVAIIPRAAGASSVDFTSQFEILK